MSEEKGASTFEEIKVKSGELVDRIKEIVEEGTARRVTIKKGDRVMLEVPLAVGVGGAAAAVWLTPVLAALGAMAALATDVRIVVEREEEAPADAELAEADETTSG